MKMTRRLAAVLVIALTAWQVTRVVRLSAYKTELNATVRRDRAEAEKLTRDAGEIRRGMNQQELAIVSAAAAEANDLIDQRAFSWTAPGVPMLTFSLAVMPKPSRKKMAIETQKTGLRS